MVYCIYLMEQYIKENLKIINEFKPNKFSYKGGFKNGKREGFGIEIKSNGDKYEGQWKNGKYNGYGILYKSNGMIFDGKFKNNLFHGYSEEYFLK